MTHQPMTNDAIARGVLSRQATSRLQSFLQLPLQSGRNRPVESLIRLRCAGHITSGQSSCRPAACVALAGPSEVTKHAISLAFKKITPNCMLPEKPATHCGPCFLDMGTPTCHNRKRLSALDGKGLAMRWTALLLVFSSGMWFVGCGGSTPTPGSVASHAGLPPPPPGGEGTPPSPMPPGGETPPPESTPEPMPPGGEPQPAGTGSADSGPALAGGDSSYGGQPGEQPGGSPDFNPEGAPQPPRIKTWQEQAEEALAAGNEQEWFRLHYTNYAVNPSSWPELDKKMAWIPALRLPAFGPRFGIGALYINPPKDFDGSPQPIGSSELSSAMSSLQQNAGSGAGGGGGGGETRRTRRSRTGEGPAAGGDAGGEVSGQRPESGSAQDSELAHYTGDFGTKLIAALKERVESGAYGAVYREMGQTPSRGPRRRGDPNNPADASGELPGLAGGTSDGGGYDPSAG